MGLAEGIYHWLPGWAQHVAVSVYGLGWCWQRFGPGYRRYLREYADRDRWTADQWQAWQQRHLRAVLQAAAEQTPYYRRVWSRGERAAARAGRLDALPLLGKEPLRTEPTALIRHDLKRAPSLVFPTSGTTGTPVRTYWSTEELRRSMAVREVRSLGWAHTSYALPRATFGCRLAVTDLDDTRDLYRLNLVEHQVYFSAYHLRPDTVAAYVRALHRHRIRWLTGYASACHFMAQIIREQRLAVPPLAAVITTSERLTPDMRRVMEQAFACRVFEEYGTVEHASLATECECGRLHVSPDVGIVEILRPDGTACAPNEVGELVATALLRTAQPLVRYRQGDLAAWDAEPCPCGRAMPVIKEIMGRTEDVLQAPDGRRLFRFCLVFGGQSRIREGQVVQEALDRFRLNVVPAPGYGPADRDDLIRRVRHQVGANVTVVVETVERIPRTAAGKFSMVVSQLKPQNPAATPIDASLDDKRPSAPMRCPTAAD